MSTTRQLVRPPALRPGDTIGIVAPASNVNRADFEAGCASLRVAGYKLTYSDSIFDRDLYFAGSVVRRARELEDMFTRDDVRAIICARGGYGSNHLLPELDLEKIKNNPKIFVGYSDITTLSTYLLDAVGLAAFHGPMVAKDWYHSDGVDLPSWQFAVSHPGGWDVPLNPGVKALIDGNAEGILYGGCLSILVASLGTPYEIKTDGTILFLEDIAAKPFQVDRMLMQLRLGGFLNDVRGLVFGQMLECSQSPNQDYTLEEVILRVVGDLGVPVAFGVRSGHVTSGNITLPLGVRASIRASSNGVSLKILEGAVS